jgi:hypothetical protein
MHSRLANVLRNAVYFFLLKHTVPERRFLAIKVFGFSISGQLPSADVGNRENSICYYAVVHRCNTVSTPLDHAGVVPGYRTFS